MATAGGGGGLPRTRQMEMWRRALKSLPGGTNSNFRAWDEDTVYIDRGKGGVVWDLDGNEFVDLRMGYGPVILGHADPRVDDHVNERMRRGVSFSLTSEDEVTAAELVCELTFCDMARLATSGDLEGGSSSGGYFDGALEKAVKRFQASNGLTPTGIVDDRTASAMNVPADVRLKQLKTNLGRVAELAVSRPKKYVIVNIPAAHVEAVENDTVISRHTGVVGKTERPTPLLRSAITNLNFNPSWTLPPTVVSKDLIPKGIDMQRRNQNVLVKFGIDAYDGAGKKLDPAKINWASSTPQGLTYKQQPGKENPLGFLKINFDSENSVYMHDTPSETLFGKNVRAASSGCVRVANIEVLAAWLLGNQGWSEDRVRKMRENGERQDVSLKHSVPLNFVYITAWATPDGVVQFRRDLYQKDGVGPIAASY